MPTPSKLERPPVMEAVFELRFAPKTESAATILPGLLFKAFNGQFGEATRLPFDDVPRQALVTHPALRYAPRLRLTGKPFSIFIGDRSLLVSCVKPYPGWGSFKPIIRETVVALRNTELVETIERCSIKYVNLLEAPRLAEQFPKLRFTAQLGKYNLAEWASQVQTEIHEDEIIYLIEVRANAIVTTSDNQVATGIFVAIDAIKDSPVDFWDNADRTIEQLHTREKEIFFGLLTQETIDSFGANY